MFGPDFSPSALLPILGHSLSSSHFFVCFPSMSTGSSYSLTCSASSCEGPYLSQPVTHLHCQIFVGTHACYTLSSWFPGPGSSSLLLMLLMPWTLFSLLSSCKLVSRLRVTVTVLAHTLFTAFVSNCHGLPMYLGRSCGGTYDLL